MLKKLLLIFLIIFTLLGTSFLCRKFLFPESKPGKKIIITGNMSLHEISDMSGIKQKKLTSVLKSGDIDGTVSLKELSLDTESNLRKLRGIVEFKQLSENVGISNKIKFLSWLIFLLTVFVVMLRGTINKKFQIIFYSLSLVLFGILLGPKPSPFKGLHTIFFFLAKYKMLYMPAIITLVVFLVIGIIFNKYLCAWGCPFGALQDLINRIFRGGRENNKTISFRISNTIRVIVFAAILAGALLFSIDLIGFIDVFTIFTPSVLTIGTAVFISAILLLSMFTYRPFCYFICPFGLLSWILERFSIFKIKIDRTGCTNCKVCTKRCPSNTMRSILNNDTIIPDCFSCGSCIESCPVKAVSFTNKVKK